MARYEPYRPVETLSPAAQALLTYVRANDYVTYAEMAQVLAPLIPVKGPLAAEVSTVPNLVLWIGMSQEWVDVLHELFSAGVLWRAPCASLTYLVDGAWLDMPIAKRQPKRGYATPHWAPSCVRPIEHIAPRERKRYGHPAAMSAASQPGTEAS
jgi:hypothetical protein